MKQVPTSPIHLEYTSKMRGVDVNDQLRGVYTTLTKSHKWWHRLFFFLLDVGITNSYIMHQHLSVHFLKKPKTHMNFMRDLAYALMEKWTKIREGVVSIYNSKPGTHTLYQVVKGRHICRYCKSRTRLTNLVCKDCGNVWYHYGECHENSHFPRRR